MSDDWQYLDGVLSPAKLVGWSGIPRPYVLRSSPTRTNPSPPLTPPTSSSSPPSCLIIPPIRLRSLLCIPGRKTPGSHTYGPGLLNPMTIPNAITLSWTVVWTQVVGMGWCGSWWRTDGHNQGRRWLFSWGPTPSIDGRWRRREYAFLSHAFIWHSNITFSSATRAWIQLWLQACKSERNGTTTIRKEMLAKSN